LELRDVLDPSAFVLDSRLFAAVHESASGPKQTS
jgi:hypothetical protein